MDDYGDVIRRGREALGLTQPQFAELLNVSTATLSRWETMQLTPRIPHVADLIVHGIPAKPLLEGLSIPVHLPDELNLPRELILAWTMLPPERLRIVMQFLRSILQSTPPGQPPSTGS